MFVAAELLGAIPEELAAALISNVNYLRSMWNLIIIVYIINSIKELISKDVA